MSDMRSASERDAAAEQRIVALLGVWTSGRGPLYRRLAQAFERLLRAGELPAGTRLPSERQLAVALAISRSTVVGAYDELLAGGWVERRRGSGTRVSGQADARSARERAAQARAVGHHPIIDTFLAADLTPVDLATGTVHWPADYPTSALDLSRDDREALLEGHGYAPQGIPRLRAAIAAWYTRNHLPTTPDHILVTTGAQQAISLVASLLLQHGDAVVIESPTFPGALDAFRAVGARLVALPVTPHGVQVELLRPRFAAHPNCLCYLQPTFHNPTGTTLSDAARRTLVELAREYNVALVEDLTMADLPLTTSHFPPPPPLAAYAARMSGDAAGNKEDTADGEWRITPGGVWGVREPEPTVITIGSLSKVIWGGLRVGWVRAAPSLIARLARLKAATDLGSPVLSQLQGAYLLDDLDRIRTRRRDQSMRQLAQMTEQLRDALPAWEWRRPDGALFLWVRLPYGSAQIFAQEAQRAGVVVMPGPMLAADRTCDGYVRLAFTRPPEDIARGVERLSVAWSHFAPGAGVALADQPALTI